MILAIFQLAGGVFLTTFSFMMHTKNFRSALLFKILPFWFGAVMLYTAGKMLAII